MHTILDAILIDYRCRLNQSQIFSPRNRQRASPTIISICILTINIYVSIWRQIEIGGVRRHHADTRRCFCVSSRQSKTNQRLPAPPGVSFFFISLAYASSGGDAARAQIAYLCWKAVI
jgi:hypothetical protein